MKAQVQLLVLGTDASLLKEQTAALGWLPSPTSPSGCLEVSAQTLSGRMSSGHLE